MNITDAHSEMNVVFYRCIERAKPKDGGIVAPFYWTLGHVFAELDRFADVVVKVPDPYKEMKAVVKVTKKAFPRLRKLASMIRPSNEKKNTTQ